MHTKTVWDEPPDCTTSRGWYGDKGNYLDYGPDHWKGTGRTPGDGTIHCIAYFPGRGTGAVCHYFPTIAEAKAWIEATVARLNA